STCDITCSLDFIPAGQGLGLLSLGYLRCRLRRWLGFQLWLERIVRVVVSQQCWTFYFDWRDCGEVRRESSAGQDAGGKLANATGARVTINIARSSMSLG